MRLTGHGGLEQDIANAHKRLFWREMELPVVKTEY